MGPRVMRLSAAGDVLRAVRIRVAETNLPVRVDGVMSDAKFRATQSSSAPAPSGSISSTLRPVSADSCSTIVR
jgi:hypothetical protein